jgi:hypothetical protein
VVKRFVLLGNTMRSRSDGDIHYVSAARLLDLYGLNPAECILIEYRDLERKARGLAEGLTWLGPRYNGDYRAEIERLENGRGRANHDA